MLFVVCFTCDYVGAYLLVLVVACVGTRLVCLWWAGWCLRCACYEFRVLLDCLIAFKVGVAIGRFGGFGV